MAATPRNVAQATLDDLLDDEAMSIMLRHSGWGPQAYRNMLAARADTVNLDERLEAYGHAARETAGADSGE